MFYAGLSSYISSYIHSLPILCDFFEFIKKSCYIYNLQIKISPENFILIIIIIIIIFR